MLNIIGNILGSIGLGGITGLLGSALTAYISYKNQKLAFEHDERMARIDQETIKLETQAKIEITETEYKGKVDVAESEAFGKSFASDKASYLTWMPENKIASIVIGILFALVDFVRGLTRPILTAYLCVLTTWLAYQVYMLIQLPLTHDQAYALMSQIIFVILYLTTTVVLWWFGTRNKLFQRTL
jgi:hypothetical protein